MKATKKIRLLTGLLLVLLSLYLLAFVPALAARRSDLLLRAQTASFAGQSVFAQSNLKLTVPASAQTGDGRWTDTMKLFHCGDNFPHQGPGQLSILYNFGAFDDGRSGFYDPEAATFNAHYGVYAISQTKNPFGYRNGVPDGDAITGLVAFDQLELVLASLGCPPSQRYFDAQITAIKSGPMMAGFSDWIQIDATILTNAPLYQAQGFQPGTIQYGPPPPDYPGPDFPVVPMLGRLYLRYDKTRQLTVIYFVIAKDAELIEETSANYLKPIKWRMVKSQNKAGADGISGSTKIVFQRLSP
ncbi:hypothetical protein [Acetobacterium sp.]|uniref:hypothetical protein n=1 Tax=Acetobacterium sp. TaxID=1872094 RepID=UPI0035945D94